MLVTHEISSAVDDETSIRHTGRIAEVERSLKFTKDFLENLDAPDDSVRNRVEEIAHSLERELDRLRSPKQPGK